MENQEIKYFSSEALLMFAAAQGKVVQKVICHLWLNLMNKDAAVEIIDNVELHFADGQRLTIGCNEQGDALDALKFDITQTTRELEEEFEGKIKILALDASATKMWEDVIGKTLTAVQLTKENNMYRADSALLDFGEEKRVIVMNPLDGILIDFYEEI
jgi:hypothetical protein